jgi:hypothetical protein
MILEVNMPGVAPRSISNTPPASAVEDALQRELADKLVPDVTAAPLVGVSVLTLRRWRLEGRGPRYTKVGSNVRYRLSWLREFMAARTVETSDSIKPQGACA